MRTAAGGVGAVIVAVSWIAAIAVGLYVEYLGWRTIIADDRIAEGLAIAFLAAPFAFMTVQTIIGLLAVPFAAVAEREPAPEDA